MQIGSLVVCINNNPNKTEVSRVMKDNGYVFPNNEELYTVRGFQLKGNGGINRNNIYLEEIVNKPLTIHWLATGKTTDMEMGFGINRFKEVLPPMDIEEITQYQHIKVERIETNCKEPAETH